MLEGARHRKFPAAKHCFSSCRFKLRHPRGAQAISDRPDGEKRVRRVAAAILAEIGTVNRRHREITMNAKNAKGETVKKIAIPTTVALARRSARLQISSVSSS